MSLATFSAIGTDSKVCVELPTTLLWPARRLKLVSMDFPSSQREVEHDWSYMYYSEAIRITDDARTVTVLLTRDNGRSVLQTARLPLSSNRIVSVHEVGDRTEFTTASEHGLFVDGVSLIAALEYIFGTGTVPLTLIYSRDGVLNITSAEDLAFVSDFTVSLPSSFIQGKFQGKREKTQSTETVGHFVIPPIPSPDSLCALLCGAFHGKINFSFEVSSGRTCVMGAADIAVSSVGGDTLAQWLLGFDGIFSAWEVARIPPASLSPVAFTQALQRALNPFSIETGETEFRYRDALGKTHIANIVAGQYRTPHTLVAAVEQEMQPNMPPDFGVIFEAASVRFICSSQFDLLFGNSSPSLCHALGFAQSDLVGQREYNSHSAVYSHFVRPNTNTFRVSLQDNRLSVACSTAHVIAKVESYTHGVLRVRTLCANRNPFAHGVAAGETVTLSDCDGTHPSKLKRTRRIMGVVVDNGYDYQYDIMCISVPSHGWNGTDEIVVLLPQVEFSVCALARTSSLTYFANTIGGMRLGCPDEVMFSRDGTLSAPYPMALEHPSRVVVFLEDANGDAHSTEPEHVVDDRRIFAMVLVNERRVVPAIARLRTEGNSFQFRFANLDRTPYVFNNAVVTFTIELS